MLAAQQLTIPAWTWAFFALVLLAVVVVMGLGLRKFGGGREARQPRRGRTGLTAEQKAFQDEMRLMLEVRMQERQDQSEPAPEQGTGPGPG